METGKKKYIGELQGKRVKKKRRKKKKKQRGGARWRREKIGNHPYPIQ